MLRKTENPLDDLKNDEITKRREKCEMHTEGPGIWRQFAPHGIHQMVKYLHKTVARITL